MTLLPPLAIQALGDTGKWFWVQGLLEEVLQAVAFYLVDGFQHSAKSSPGKTGPGEPDNVVLGKVYQSGPLVFAKGHCFRCQFDKGLFVRLHRGHWLPNPFWSPQSGHCQVMPLQVMPHSFSYMHVWQMEKPQCLHRQQNITSARQQWHCLVFRLCLASFFASVFLLIRHTYQ